MKTRMLIVGASIVLLVLIQIGGWAQTKYVPKENEELYGTWINQGTPRKFSYIPKQLLLPNAFGNYSKVSDSNPFEEGTFEIVSKWTDSEGNVWFKALRIRREERKA